MTQTAISVIGLAVALLTSLGSVYLSVGMKLAACPLCYYQRTFAFAALAVLAVGLAFEVQEKVTLPALALPLALGGLAIAAYHVSLEARGRMECPAGVTAALSAPKESLLAFAALSVALAYGTLISDFPAGGWRAVTTALALAAVAAPACLFTVAMPAPPNPETYRSPPLTCRPLPPPAT
ncbi:MAG: disulfide bond formation protein B [Gemmataceae bacterium]